jgi:anti-sigma28 factor (negative regulator of flagellin synthesis)
MTPLEDLREQVARQEYVIDDSALAAAILDRVWIHLARCSKPVAGTTLPASSSSAPGGPASTVPIQVTDGMRAAASGRAQTHSS